MFKIYFISGSLLLLAGLPAGAFCQAIDPPSSEDQTQAADSPPFPQETPVPAPPAEPSLSPDLKEALQAETQLLDKNIESWKKQLKSNSKPKEVLETEIAKYDETIFKNVKRDEYPILKEKDRLRLRELMIINWLAASFEILPREKFFALYRKHRLQENSPLPNSGLFADSTLKEWKDLDQKYKTK